MPSTSATTMGSVGDAEAVKPEHGLAMFKRRGGGDEEAAASGMLQAVRRPLGDSPGDVASWNTGAHLWAGTSRDELATFAVVLDRGGPSLTGG